MSKYVCITPFVWRDKDDRKVIGKVGDTFDAIPQGANWLAPGWVKLLEPEPAQEGEPAPDKPKPKRG